MSRPNLGAHCGGRGSLTASRLVARWQRCMTARQAKIVLALLVPLRGTQGRPGLEQGLEARQDRRPALGDGLEYLAARREAVVGHLEPGHAGVGLLDVEGDD